jgi:hypothetical protein
MERGSKVLSCKTIGIKPEKGTEGRPFWKSRKYLIAYRRYHRRAAKARAARTAERQWARATWFIFQDETLRASHRTYERALQDPSYVPGAHTIVEVVL